VVDEDVDEAAGVSDFVEVSGLALSVFFSGEAALSEADSPPGFPVFG
jgi:hypothetical protein